MYFISDRGENVVGNYRKENFKIWMHNVTQSDIYRIRIEDHNIERVTNDPEHLKTSLCVAKDSKRLLFVAENNGIGNLYEMDLDSRAVRPKTNSMSGISQIALSRDETKLLFAAQNKGSMDLFMIRNPFDKFLDKETLPLTKFQQRRSEQKSFATGLQKSDKDTTGSRMNYRGYGSFDIDVSRQVGSNPNLDVRESPSEWKDEPDSLMSWHSPRDYHVSISNDIVFGGVGYNSLWNNGQSTIEMLFSDLLGDHVIYTSLQLWSDLKNSNITVEYQYLPEVIDYSIRAYHNSFIQYLEGSSNPNVLDLFSLRNYGLQLGSQYSFSKFQRVEFATAWVGISKANESNPTDEPSNITRNFLVPELKYVLDNSQFGMFAPYKGTRLFLDLKVSPFTKRFALFTTDIRQYLPLWREYYGFLFRFSGGASLGPDPRKFFLGGVDNWIGRGYFGYGYSLFKDPEDFAFMQIQTPLRGFEMGQLAGKNYGLANVEFRFPFFSGFIAIPIPFVLLGAAFVDVGTAWNNDFGTIALRAPVDTLDVNTGIRRYYAPGSILLSTGVGLRTVFLGYPVKFDVAWRRDGNAWSEPNYIFSLGIDL